MMFLTGWLPELLLIPVLASICRSDLCERRVANGAVLLVLAFGVAELATDTAAADEIVVRAALMAAVFLVLAVIWQFGAIGGGDVKLMSASMIWVAPEDAGRFLFITAATGAIMGIAMLLRGRKSREEVANKAAVRARQVPYAVAICIGLAATIVTASAAA